MRHLIGCDEGTNGDNINKKRGSTAGANSPLFLVYIVSVLVTGITYANMFVDKRRTFIILSIRLLYFIIRLFTLIILPTVNTVHPISLR